MAYVKAVDFAAKDVLLTGNPAKLIKGTEIGAEFDAIATATTTMDANLTAHTGAASAAHAGTAISNTPAGAIAATTVQDAINELDTEKAPLASPTFTGTPSMPTGTIAVTQATGNNTTALATTAFVQTEITALNVSSGTYTPTLFNTTNISASVAFVSQYARIGNVVTVGGVVSVTPTAAGAITLGISLPVASNFASGSNLCGSASVDSSVVTESFAVLTDTTNKRATLRGIANAASARNIYFTFVYTVI